MIVEELTREQMIDFIKSYCVKIIKDIPNTKFKVGEYYQYYQDEDGITLLSDDKNDYFDLDYNSANEYLEGKNENNS